MRNFEHEGSDVELSNSEGVVALDVGGTGIKAGVVGADASIRQEMRRDTPVAAGVPAVVDAIAAVAGALIGPDTVGIGVGVPGVVDTATGTAVFAANIGWRDLPLAAVLSRRLGRPVVLGHDVRSAALAEARLGAGRSASSVWFVSLGTGVAAGMITAGQVDDGASGQAGELGHIVVRPGGDPCACGNRGCLETVASASRVAGRYAARTGATVTAAQVAERVRAGDPIATEIWDDAALALADGLASGVGLLDPEVVVLGGGLALAGDLLLEPVRAALVPRLPFRSVPPVLRTELGDRAGLLGVALRTLDSLPAAS
jgi:glucokinase